MGLIMEVEREMFVGLIQGIHVDTKKAQGNSTKKSKATERCQTCGKWA